eukprot:10175807-Lingulodinium_polyedra.AAC.1
MMRSKQRFAVAAARCSRVARSMRGPVFSPRVERASVRCASRRAREASVRPRLCTAFCNRRAMM